MNVKELEELFGVSLKDIHKTDLNLFEYLHAVGLSYSEIARRLAQRYRKGFKEKIDEELMPSAGFTAVGSKSGKVYSFMPLPMVDYVVPYDEFMSNTKKEVVKEARGEITGYVYDLVQRVKDLDMTDLFIEADNNTYVVSYKELGGGKVRLELLSKEKGRQVINALKVMASKTRGSNVKVNVSDVPQSGQIRFDEFGIEVRIEFIPTVLGESVSMRFFKIGTYFNISLEELGYEQDVIEIADRIAKLNKGMVLVSGATGQGKSTFIKSIILRANPEVKVVRAIEDPVESVIRGVLHVQAKEGFISFSSAIRSFMRANPDIIFVGEVRDPETAVALLEASITGHLTFSTTHATSSVIAVLRVLNKALETGLFSREELLTNIAGSLVASFVQRLVKLTPAGQERFGRKVLPVVEYFVPTDEDRKLIEEGRLLDIYIKLKEEGKDIAGKLKELYKKGYISEETYLANLEDISHA